MLRMFYTVTIDAYLPESVALDRYVISTGVSEGLV